MNAIFDPYAALQKLQKQQGLKGEKPRVAPATSATFATPMPETAQKSQMSRKSQAPERKSAFSQNGGSPYGTSPGGRPLTWTGKVVSLDDWRTLSEWEKHGPAGKSWSPETQTWEDGA